MSAGFPIVANGTGTGWREIGQRFKISADFPDRFRFDFAAGKPSAMPTVKFTNLKKQITVPEGANLRKEGLKNGIPMHEGVRQTLNCMGNGFCASCRVRVVAGEENLKRKRWWEKALQILNPEWMFARIGHEKDLTLACQTKVYGDCEVEATPAMNWHGENFWGS